MSKTIRRLLIGLGIFVGALVVLVVGVGLFFNANDYKPQIEKSVSQATGMSLKINGQASLKIIPRIRIQLDDVHLARSGKEIFAAQAFEVSPELFPFLFHREIIVDKVALISPKVHIEKEANGKYNFETAQTSTAASPSKKAKGAAGQASSGESVGAVNSVEIKNADVAYLDKSAQQNVQISGLNADFSKISWNAKDMMKSLTLSGRIQAQTLQVITPARTTSVSNIKMNIRDDHGLVHLDPTQMSAFGGIAKGSASVDLRGALPKIEISQTASNIHLDQAAPQLKNKLSGTIEAAVNLSASGMDSQAITRSMAGTIAVHSRDLKTSLNLDDLASKLKTAKGLDLVGVGSSLFSSPMVAKAGEAAGIAGGTPKPPENPIRYMVSDWSINKGTAEAKDVAIATTHTTVAFKGDLNMIDRKYQNFYVATVDPKGCTKNKVEVGGSLDSPRPVVGSVGKQLSESYLGSAGSAAGSTESKIAGLFGGGGKKEPKASPSGEPSEKSSSGCDQFYSGSALHLS